MLCYHTNEVKGMRDFPVFTTQWGVASLVLREVPYKGEAYITIRDTSNSSEFLRECVEFCRAVGAKYIYGTGHKVMEEYPLHTAVYRMRAALDALPDSDAMLSPVTEKTLEQWRSINNDKMASVPNAATMSKSDAQDMLQKGEGYFVYKDGVLLGIGKVGQESVSAIASVVPGAGERVLCALCHGLLQSFVEVDVASENKRALRFYERLGFVKIAEISRWYKIFEDVK